MIALPPWAGAAAAPSHPPLREDARAGVCVVGAGFTGLLTSLLLCRRGAKVVVLEQGALGSGESGRSTGHLTTALDSGYLGLERLRGGRAARLAAESHSAALELLSGLCAGDGIACGLETVDGFLIGRIGREREIDEEAEAARRAGLIEVERLGRVPGDAFGSCGCLRFPRQAQVDPARLLKGLCRAVEAAGGRIHSRTRVVAVEGGSPAVVRSSEGFSVRADAAVLAVHDMLDGPRRAAGMVRNRTFVLASRLPPRSLPRAVYWDCERPYHYVRAFSAGSDREYLVVGGEDHPAWRKGSPEERFGRLEAWMRRHFPMAGPVTHRWSGQILEPPDGLPFVGRDPRRRGVLVATGFSGNGITHAAVAGMLFADLVRGRSNPWEELYDPTRPRGRAAALARKGLRFARGLARYLEPAQARVARLLSGERPG